MHVRRWQTDLRLVTLQGVLVRRIQTKLAKVDDLSFSPDGRLLTYWGSQDLKAGGGQLYTQATDGTAAPKALTGAEFDDADPDFSPNGTEIVFRRFVKNGAKEYPQIAVIAVGGGQARILTDGDSIKQGPVWSPDGRQIAYKDNLQPAGAPARDELWLLTARKSGGETIGGTNPHRLVIDGRDAVQGSPAWETAEYPSAVLAERSHRARDPANCPNQPDPPAVRDLLRNRMSLQASHTEAGIRPMACSRPKATQPRQSPKADSRKAAAAIRPTNTQGSVEDSR